MSKLRRALSSLVAVLVLFAAVGCGDDSGSVSEEGSGSASGSGTASGSSSDSSSSAESAELEANPWELTNIGPIQPVEGTPAGFIFKDGTVSGTAGCNRLSGSYEVDGDSIKIGPLAGTQMACEEKLMVQETAVQKALEASKSFNITGETLELAGDTGVLLTLAAAPGVTF